MSSVHEEGKKNAGGNGGFRPFSAAETEALLDWFASAGRTLPWRSDPEPYRVWLSEIMLQQTRVDAVLPYFERFLSALPDIPSLAAAGEEELLKLWEGLGYYSRVRNLKKAAVLLCEKYGGRLPPDPEELRKLPGIGPYTAGAIASIAFGIPAPAVDGNVLRVLARVSGCEEDVRTDAARKHTEQAVKEMIPEGRAGMFTQALMEIGALVCVPNGEAKCGSCPLRGGCFAFENGCADRLPVRSGLPPRRREERTVLLLTDGDRVALRKRPPSGLLAGLYEFPNVPGILGAGEAVNAARKLGFEPLRAERLPDATHLFSHVEWRMAGWLLTGYADGSREELLFAGRRELDDVYAVPSAFAAFLKIFRGEY